MIFKFFFLGGGVLPCLDPDPLTHFISDPIRIRNTGKYVMLIRVKIGDPAPVTFNEIRYFSDVPVHVSVYFALVFISTPLLVLPLWSIKKN